MLDAMNKPVTIGQTYGYTTSKGSFVTVVVGRARKLTEKKVTLDVLSKSRFLYGAPIADDFESEKKHVSIYACHLFPVIGSDPQKRIALGFDIQRNVMHTLKENFDSLGFKALDVVCEAALAACEKHGLVPAETEV